MVNLLPGLQEEEDQVPSSATATGDSSSRGHEQQMPQVESLAQEIEDLNSSSHRQQQQQDEAGRVEDTGGGVLEQILM